MIFEGKKLDWEEVKFLCQNLEEITVGPDIAPEMEQKLITSLTKEVNRKSTAMRFLYSLLGKHENH